MKHTKTIKPKKIISLYCLQSGIPFPGLSPSISYHNKKKKTRGIVPNFPPLNPTSRKKRFLNHSLDHEKFLVINTPEKNKYEKREKKPPKNRNNAKTSSFYKRSRRPLLSRVNTIWWTMERTDCLETSTVRSGLTGFS